MLPSVTQAAAVSAIQHSPQGNNPLTPRLEFIEKQLSSIEHSKVTHDIQRFSDLIKDNKNKILAFPAHDDRMKMLLVKSSDVLSAIVNNNNFGDDNTDNYHKLSQLGGEVEGLLREKENNKSKAVEQRIQDEVKRSAKKVENEVSRTSDKVCKEAKRIFKRF